MKFLFTLFLLIFSNYSEAGTKNESCIQIYIEVNKAGGNLSSIEVGKFLNAIGCKYYSSVEGGEFGAELIISVLENSTHEFIEEFDKLNPVLQEVIMRNVTTPIHDGFDFQIIHDNIKRTKTSSETKGKLLLAIKSAAKELNIEIK